MSNSYSTTERGKRTDGKAILLHESDDVATALIRLEAGESIGVSLGRRTEEVVLQEENIVLRTVIL